MRDKMFDVRTMTRGVQGGGIPHEDQTVLFSDQTNSRRESGG
jgi:hypothetical protein